MQADHTFAPLTRVLQYETPRSPSVNQHTVCTQADYINTAYERMVKADVRYRFVIDIQGSIVV